MLQEIQTMVHGAGGAPAPCVFQRLAWVGNGLDGELAQLVPPEPN